MIDFLSDTVTQPCEEMRKVMANAAVGDDVYAEDPSVNALESLAAELLGKPSALFVPSGTMANLISFLTHVPRGGKILLGDSSDGWLWEAQGASVLGGCAYQPIATEKNGELKLCDLYQAMELDDDEQVAVSRLIVLENTHGASGGSVLSNTYLRSVEEFSTQQKLKTHMDGARFWNAVVASGDPPHLIAGSVDSISFCLSKGLGAPVGSMIVGDRDFIISARRWRKMIGGGMRQAGVVAAAGHYALQHRVKRLAEDHENAKRLASGLALIDELIVENPLPETNIVYFRLRQNLELTKSFTDTLQKSGVRVAELQKNRIRAVTHFDTNQNDVDVAVMAIKDVIQRMAK